MKFTITLSVVLLGAACWSCSGNSSNSKGNDSAADDTVAIQATEDTVQPELLVTPDLTLLEVKGNVKEIKGKEVGDYIYGDNAKFNEKGELTHYGNSEPIDKISNVKRDGEGRLIEFLISEWMTVKWEGDRPLSITYKYNEMTNTNTYKYDNKGLIVEIKNRYQDEIAGSDDIVTGIVTYPADGFDAKGNWIKRTVKWPTGTITEAREIIYY